MANDQAAAAAPEGAQVAENVSMPSTSGYG